MQFPLLDRKMKSGIYKILNIVTDKFYIGSSIDIQNRFKEHIYGLKNNKHGNRHLQASWNKYHFSSFQFLIVEYCEMEKLIEREQYYIDLYKCYNDSIGYNININAINSLGVKRSEETKRKIGLAKKGTVISEERKQARRDYRHTEETKEKIRARKGWNHSEASKLKMHIKAIIRKDKRKPFSEETKEKLRQAALRQWAKQKNSNMDGFDA